MKSISFIDANFVIVQLQIFKIYSENKYLQFMTIIMENG